MADDNNSLTEAQTEMVLQFQVSGLEKQMTSSGDTSNDGALWAAADEDSFSSNGFPFPSTDPPSNRTPSLLQDFTGIDDMNVCRDVLSRHQWNLEVAIQEQLNIREGRPSVYATESEARPPTVINDRFMQHIFTSSDTAQAEGADGGGGGGPWSILGLFRSLFRICYNALASNLMLLLNLFRTPDRIVTDPLGDVLNFIAAYNEKFADHPVFYQGTYSQALNDAKRELRFMLVYLHSEQRNAAQAASLCRNALANAQVIDYISRNMLFWGCDVSSPEGKRARLLCLLLSANVVFHRSDSSRFQATACRTR